MNTVVFGVGYIGSQLASALLTEGRPVVGLDNLYATDQRAIAALGQSPDYRFVEGSVLDPAAVEEALAGDVEEVYLLAAQASAGASAADPDYTERVNLQGPRVVLDALVRRGIRAPLVYASSTRVYGSPLPRMVGEETPTGRFGDLAHLSKCYVEKLLDMYASLHGLPTRAVRLGLTYGLAPVMKTDPRFMTAPNLFCYRAARGEPLELRTADPIALIHVEDAVAALRLAARAPLGDGPAIVNAATDARTLGEVAAAVRTIAGRHDRSVVVLDRTAGAVAGPRPRVSSRLTRHGFRPRRGLEDGLDEVFDHFLVGAMRDADPTGPRA